MGPLAAPVGCGAVLLKIVLKIPPLDDSNLIRSAERERLAAIIRRKAVAVSVCAVDHAQVCSLGLTRARHLATAGAVAGLRGPAEYLLVHAVGVPSAPPPHRAGVKGDRAGPSLMAPPVVAQVARARA